MCGICGIVDFRSGSEIDRDRLRRMCTTLAHRGPDREGIYVKGPAGLGHRRLSIIDLQTGDQPMPDETRTLWTVFNGEIYNFQSLRRNLEGEGVRFLTQSDTEVLPHLFKRFGWEMLEHLRGMFAFAIWDEREERLFLARDRLGQKPLFYYERGGLLIFASEIKAILEHPEIKREIDPVAFDDFLTYNCVPPPRTMFAGIQKLPPAHFLVFDRGGLKVERYWDVEFRPDPKISFEEAKAGVLQRLTEATELRMISDVPLGAFLSGGVDSSLIVALMSRAGAGRMKTYSIGFEQEAWSELPYARAVAERYGTEHHEFTVRPEAIQLLPRLIEQFDEPFGDSSAIPTYVLAEMTRKHVKVALNGDGGDESFAGYPRHLGALLLERYQKLPRWFRVGVVPGLIPDRQGRGRFFRRLRRMNEASLLTLERAYCSFIEIHSPEDKAALRGRGLTSLLGSHDSRQALVDLLKAGRGGDETLGRLLYTDLNAYLPDDLLVKIDRMTMAHGLEGRSPLLDHRLVEYAARLPAKYKVHGRTLKYLLKSIARDFVPPELIDRPKQGFAVPVGEWFRGELKPLVSRLLASSRFVAMGWLDRGAVDAFWAEHLSGDRNHRHKLWGLINLELWHQRYIENKEIDLQS